MPSQPDRPAGQAEDEPDIKGRRLIAAGAEALAHRSGGRTEARRDGQQDCLVHQSRSARLAAPRPACTSAGRDSVMEPAQRGAVSTPIASGCAPRPRRSGSGCARSGQAAFRVRRAAGRRALRNRGRRRSPCPSDLGHQSFRFSLSVRCRTVSCGPSALARGCPPPPPRNRSGPGTPGRPGDTGAARWTSGPATPATRSGHANDHPVPPCHQHSSGNWTL